MSEKPTAGKPIRACRSRATTPASSSCGASSSDLPQDAPSPQLRRRFYAELEHADRRLHRRRQWFGLFGAPAVAAAVGCLFVGVDHRPAAQEPAAGRRSRRAGAAAATGDDPQSQPRPGSARERFAEQALARRHRGERSRRARSGGETRAAGACRRRPRALGAFRRYRRDRPASGHAVRRRRAHGLAGESRVAARAAGAGGSRAPLRQPERSWNSWCGSASAACLHPDVAQHVKSSVARNRV